jgi:hypothetical protein
MALRASSRDEQTTEAAVAIPCRSKNSFANAFDDSICERQGELGADDRQVDPQFLRDVGELHDLVRRDRKAVGDFGDPRIAGRAVDHLGSGAPRH